MQVITASVACIQCTRVQPQMYPHALRLHALSLHEYSSTTITNNKNWLHHEVSVQLLLLYITAENAKH